MGRFIRLESSGSPTYSIVSTNLEISGNFSNMEFSGNFNISLKK